MTERPDSSVCRGDRLTRVGNRWVCPEHGTFAPIFDSADVRDEVSTPSEEPIGLDEAHIRLWNALLDEALASRDIALNRLRAVAKILDGHSVTARHSHEAAALWTEIRETISEHPPETVRRDPLRESAE